MRPLLLLGATGATGQRISSELVRRGLRPTLVGRREAVRALGRELGCPARVVPLEELELRGEHVVLSCVGPFMRHGVRLAAQAARVGATWLDVTGEQAFVHHCQALHAQATDSGAVISNAVGVEVMLADACGALAAAGLDEVHTLDSASAITGGLSVGSARTVLAVAGGETLTWHDGPVPGRPGGALRRIELADWPHPWAVELAFAEALTLPWHIEVPRVRTWALLPLAVALSVRGTAPLALRLSRSALAGRVDAWLAARRSPPMGSGRLAVSVTATGRRRGRAETRTVTVYGGDPYDTTGTLVAWLLERLLTGTSLETAGWRAPAQLIDPRTLLAAAPELGLRFVTQLNGSKGPEVALGA